MLLEKIVLHNSKKDFFELHFASGERLNCSLAQMADFAVYSGREFTEEEYGALKAAAAMARTREKAAALLAYRAMSCAELERKLVEKGETPENASAAAEWLRELGAIDELEYARGLVRHYSRKGWGAGRIKEEFYRRRLPREYWEEALAELEESTEQMVRFVEKRIAARGTDPKEKKKTADALFSRGFAWEDIKRVIAEYYDESNEDGY